VLADRIHINPSIIRYLLLVDPPPERAAFN